VQFTYTSEQLALRERASRRLIIANEIGKRGLRPLLEFGSGAPREAMAHA
jgi:hypothetical protein